MCQTTLSLVSQTMSTIPCGLIMSPTGFSETCTHSRLSNSSHLQQLGERKQCAATVEAGRRTSHPQNFTGDLTSQTYSTHRSHLSALQCVGVSSRVADEANDRARLQSVRRHQRHIHRACPDQDVTLCAPTTGEKKPSV